MLRRRQYRQRPENDPALVERLRKFDTLDLRGRVRDAIKVAGEGQAGLEQHTVGKVLLAELKAQ